MPTPEPSTVRPSPGAGDEAGAAPPVGWTDIQLVKRHPSILPRGRTALVLIDLQERLMGSMHAVESLREGVLRLLKAAEVLDLPLVVTEQYRKGLGPTDVALQPHLDRAHAIEKLSFSAVGNREFVEHLDRLAPTHILLAGIETHVCVAQTALDLSVRGLKVSVAADAVSSRRAADRETALARLRISGITVSTTEALIFELTEQAGTAEFKKILEIVR